MEPPRGHDAAGFQQEQGIDRKAQNHLTLQFRLLRFPVKDCQIASHRTVYPMESKGEQVQIVIYIM